MVRYVLILVVFISRVWFLTGGKPAPEKVFQAGQVQQAINSVKSVLFSPQVMKVEPTAVRVAADVS